MHGLIVLFALGISGAVTVFYIAIGITIVKTLRDIRDELRRARQPS